MIRTTSKSPIGHWRAGVFHSPKGSEWPDDQFDPERLEILEADPRLTVEHIDGEPTGKPPARTLPGEGTDGAELAQRTADLDAREQLLDEREAGLEEREEALATREQDVATKEEAVAAIKANPDVRVAVLKGAVRKVIAGKAEGDFTTDGKPKTEAIEREALGFDITAKERDALFEALSAEKA